MLFIKLLVANNIWQVYKVSPPGSEFLWAAFRPGEPSFHFESASRAHVFSLRTRLCERGPGVKRVGSACICSWVISLCLFVPVNCVHKSEAAPRKPASWCSS